eukprot:511704_1
MYLALVDKCKKKREIKEGKPQIVYHRHQYQWFEIQCVEAYTLLETQEIIFIPTQIVDMILFYSYIRRMDILTEEQEKLLSISIQPLTEIECIHSRHQTLCYWLQICSSRFDFSNPNQNVCEAIQRKKQILSNIFDYLNVTDDIWHNEQILQSIMKMIKQNLFRSLPLTPKMLLH